MTIKALVDERVETFIDFILNNTKYGDVLSHDFISGMIGVEKSLNAYYNVISCARKQLITHGKTIRSVREVGYKVLEPDEYNQYSYELFLKGADLINLSRDVNVYAPKDMMTEKNQVINQKMILHTTSYADFLRKRAEELRELVSPEPENTEGITDL